MKRPPPSYFERITEAYFTAWPDANRNDDALHWQRGADGRAWIITRVPWREARWMWPEAREA